MVIVFTKVELRIKAEHKCSVSAVRLLDAHARLHNDVMPWDVNNIFHILSSNIDRNMEDLFFFAEYHLSNIFG